jgi:hypothetical protein
MVTEIDRQEFGTRATTMKRWQRAAWIIMAIADVGLLAWGAMAALLPERLPGPDSTPILSAEYENFTEGAWQGLQTHHQGQRRFLRWSFACMEQSS